MEINSIQLLIFLGTMIVLLCIWIGELSKKIARNRELINKLVGQWEKATNQIHEFEKRIEAIEKGSEKRRGLR